MTSFETCLCLFSSNSYQSTSKTYSSAQYRSFCQHWPCKRTFQYCFCCLFALWSLVQECPYDQRNHPLCWAFHHRAEPSLTNDHHSICAFEADHSHSQSGRGWFCSSFLLQEYCFLMWVLGPTTHYQTHLSQSAFLEVARVTDFHFCLRRMNPAFLAWVQSPDVQFITRYWICSFHCLVLSFVRCWLIFVTSIGVVTCH